MIVFTLLEHCHEFTNFISGNANASLACCPCPPDSLCRQWHKNPFLEEVLLHADTGTVISFHLLPHNLVWPVWDSMLVEEFQELWQSNSYPSNHATHFRYVVAHIWGNTTKELQYDIMYACVKGIRNSKKRHICICAWDVPKKTIKSYMP